MKLNQQGEHRMASLYDLYSRAGAGARAGNIARFKEARGIYEGIAGMYAPGGAFGRGYEAMLERTKGRDVASGASALVGTGLYNTTQTAGLGKKWEEDVGMPSRMRLEDIRMERYAGAQRDIAGLLERVEEPYPDYGGLMQATAAQSAASSYGSAGSRWATHPIMGGAAAASREAFLAPGRRRPSGFAGIIGKPSIKGSGSRYGMNPYMG
jgi:hypothetical protein